MSGASGGSAASSGSNVLPLAPAAGAPSNDSIDPSPPITPRGGMSTPRQMAVRAAAAGRRSSIRVVDVLTGRGARGVYHFEAESAEALVRWLAVLGETATGNALRTAVQAEASATQKAGGEGELEAARREIAAQWAALAQEREVLEADRAQLERCQVLTEEVCSKLRDELMRTHNAHKTTRREVWRLRAALKNQVGPANGMKIETTRS